MDAYREWTVLPHGRWHELAENLRYVEGTLPGEMNGWPRTMTAIRRADGTLVLHSAVALEEPAMAELEAWGRPAILVVPNGSHRTDAYVFKQRYPDLRIHCPINNRANVEKVVPVDGSYDDFPADETVRAEHLDGVNGWEGVLHVRSRDGVTLVFGDVITWLPDLPEPARSYVEPFGFIGPEPKIGDMARDDLVRDGDALAAHLERLASIPDLVRIIPGHGEPIRDGVRKALRDVGRSVQTHVEHAV